MNIFLPSNTIQRIKINRNPQKFQENHYLCIQQAFCNIPVEIPYHSIPCICQRTFHKSAEKRRYNTYMQNHEIQRFAFVPTFCVFVKTEVVPIKMNGH